MESNSGARTAFKGIFRLMEGGLLIHGPITPQKGLKPSEGR